MIRIQTHLVCAVLVLSAAWASHAEAAGPSQAQQALERAAGEQKYMFLMFYREDNAATRTMAQHLKAGLAARSHEAAICYVSVTDPSEQAVVKQFGVARAPLPFTLAVAPNGAVTALMAQQVTEAKLHSAFVTAGMAECMKAMQDRKLVLICVQPAQRSATPQGVLDFQADPEFSQRVEVLTVHTGDRSEAPFLKQMSIEPATTKQSTIVFMAPPAVLVGKFAATATKSELAAALHAAGQCCDDPHCKHNHGPQATKSSNARK